MMIINIWNRNYHVSFISFFVNKWTNNDGRLVTLLPQRKGQDGDWRRKKDPRERNGKIFWYMKRYFNKAIRAKEYFLNCAMHNGMKWINTKMEHFTNSFLVEWEKEEEKLNFILLFFMINLCRILGFSLFFAVVTLNLNSRSEKIWKIHFTPPSHTHPRIRW